MGSDGEDDDAVRRWLLDNTDDLPLDERILQAEYNGVEDIIDELKAKG
jgi:hypothetical protein